jgi:AraC family transcriptional activator of pobA
MMGDCGFCDHTIHFIIRNEKSKDFLFSTLQGKLAEELLKKSHITNDYSSIVLSIKHNADCKFNYGQNYYGFDEGVLAFMEPGQIASGTQNRKTRPDGWLLVFHPDLIRNKGSSKLRWSPQEI